MANEDPFPPGFVEAAPKIARLYLIDKTKLHDAADLDLILAGLDLLQQTGEVALLSALRHLIETIPMDNPQALAAQARIARYR